MSSRAVCFGMCVFVCAGGGNLKVSHFKYGLPNYGMREREITHRQTERAGRYS